MSGLALLPLIPVAGAVVIVALHRAPVLRDIALVGTACALFAAVLTWLPDVLAGQRPASAAWTVVPGLSIQLIVEPLGMLFALVASGLWIPSALYAIGYMRGNDEPRQTGFHAWFALALAATQGIALAGNLFTLFLFYEVLTLVTWPLVTHKRDAASIRAGRTYLLMLVGSSFLLFLPGVVWVAVAVGDLGFRPNGTLAGALSAPQMGLILALFVFGIGKAAVMPLHRWLPAAMVAPTPVSALLHAVAVVKAGVFCIVKVMVYVIGVDTLASHGGGAWLPVVAGASVVLASVIAIRQDDLKRRLAYSTISQLSYMVLAVSVLTPLSTIAAALHIAMHAVGKITLFFAAGAIYTAAHKSRISEMTGIGRRMPWTMGAFAIGALSMIGVPPAGGFVSKWFLASGALSNGHWVALTVIVVGTVLSAAYLLPVLYTAFRAPAPEEAKGVHEAPVIMVIALTATAAATILIFLFPGVPLTLARALVAPP